MPDHRPPEVLSLDELRENVEYARREFNAGRIGLRQLDAARERLARAESAKPNATDTLRIIMAAAAKARELRTSFDADRAARAFDYASVAALRQEIGNRCGPADAVTAPFDTGRVHGPAETAMGATLIASIEPRTRPIASIEPCTRCGGPGEHCDPVVGCGWPNADL